MCHLASWVMVKTQEKDINFYLTTKELKNKRGAELKKHLGKRYKEDVKGHGAIEWYFGIKGKHVECTDFSTPDNFPKEIARDIKKGLFNYTFSNDLLIMLTLKALAKYEKIIDRTWAEYKEIEGKALAEYKEIEGPAFWGIFKEPNNRIKAWR